MKYLLSLLTIVILTLNLSVITGENNQLFVLPWALKMPACFLALSALVHRSYRLRQLRIHSPRKLSFPDKRKATRLPGCVLPCSVGMA